MESNTQQHLMKMMTAYNKLKIEHTKLHEEHDKLSSQVANLTLVEPVKLTDAYGNSSFTFNITLSRGWSSPPFSVLDGYTFSIKHKEGKKASLMMLKGENDDQLKWPMNLPYKLEIRIEEPRRTTIKGKKIATTRHTVSTVQLLDNFARVTSVCSKEIADIDLRERELLNYEVVVRLVAVSFSLQTAVATAVPPLVYPIATAVPTRMCPECFETSLVSAKFCVYCGSSLYGDERELM
jgi:hypothetical protein